MSIATEIARIAEAKADVKRAINAKGGSLVNERLTDYASAIDALIPVEFNNRVQFIDYDGTILKTQYVADGESATAPEPPSHPGLVFQGWNCSYENVSNHCNVGATYTTESGDSEFDIIMLASTGLTVTFYPYLEAGTLTIDWGDGISDTIYSAGRQTVSYTYTEYGRYTIRMSISSGGSWYIPEGFCQGTENSYYLTAVRCGNIQKIGDGAFQNKLGLQTISISRDVNSVGSRSFYNCRALVAIIFPDGVEKISNEICYFCYALSQVAIGNGVTAISENAFNNCFTLDSVVIPDGVSHIGNYAFRQCYALDEIVFPDTLLSIGEYAFEKCVSLRHVKIPDGTTTISARAFNECSSMESVKLPDSITSLGENVFANCRSLKSINIPSQLRELPEDFCYYCVSLESIDIPENIEIIGEGAFYECYRLINVSFHRAITTIRSSAFRNCYAMRNYYCYRDVPPTLSSYNALEGIPGNCVIWVPASTDRTVLTAYKTASNWSNYANYMAEMEV